MSNMKGGLSLLLLLATTLNSTSVKAELGDALWACIAAETMYLGTAASAGTACAAARVAPNQFTGMACAGLLVSAAGSALGVWLACEDEVETTVDIPVFNPGGGGGDGLPDGESCAGEWVQRESITVYKSCAAENVCNYYAIVSTYFAYEAATGLGCS